MEGEAGGAVTLFEMTRCCDLRALATPESQTGAPDFSKSSSGLHNRKQSKGIRVGHSKATEILVSRIVIPASCKTLSIKREL